MRIIFMGSPGFAIPSLLRIFVSRHEIAAVVTTPDKPRGRGQALTFSHVKEDAIRNNIPVLQPYNLKDPEFLNQLRKYDADLYVVVAFRILPKEVFSLPPKGSFNLHASLLPKFRGAAPIQWALIKGETETGVTTFALQEKVDTGNIYIQKQIPISDEDDFRTLHDKLSLVGADTLIDTIEMIDAGDYRLISQNDSLATSAPKISQMTGLLDWTKSSIEIHNLVRGLSPNPSAYFFHRDKKIKIYKTDPVDDIVLKPGEILEEKNRLFIGCGTGALEIKILQMESKKKLSAAEFLRGYSFAAT